MAGKDRHGAWFARRSVHEGMGFEKFKRAVQREFPESLAVQGAPGEGAIRGLTGDRRLERLDVEDKGRVEVYQLSAQFPGPVTPREFMTLLCTGENALTGKSEMEVGGNSGVRAVPRHFMVVSKPVKHLDAPERAGFIRGQYESVEMIREIPLSKENPELNPVEWIMITRSDPGGGIPRFMVERGTPSAMIADVHKFLDWATAMEEVPDADADADKQQETSESTVETNEPAPAADATAVAAAETATETATAQPNGETSKQGPPVEPSSQAGGGVVSNITNTLEAGINTYAPAAVSSYLPNNGTDGGRANFESSSSSDEASSINSFISAEEERHHTATEARQEEEQKSQETLSDNRSATSLTATNTTSPESPPSKKPETTEKSMQRLQQKQNKLDDKLAKKRETEEAKLQSSRQKEESEQVKAREKFDREVKKTEERHQRELAKLEAKKAKELQKVETKRRKMADRDALSRVARERDEFREQVDVLRKEMESVKGLLAEAQRENTALAGRLGKLGGGGEALAAVRRELEGEAGGNGKGRSRASSLRSARSGTVG